MEPQHSNKKIWLVAASIIVLAIVVVLAYNLLTPHKSPPIGQTGQPSLPVSSSTNQGGIGEPQPGQTAPTLQIAGQAGNIITYDFLHNGVTIADNANPGFYFLSGTLPCATGQCPAAAPSTEYEVLYNANKQFFNVALTQEPLGKSRTDVEIFLERTLGLSAAQLCSLRYFVTTDSRTNSIYAGKSLGFDGCAGATALPQ